eukprot:Pgem_evm2s4945
MLTDVKYLQDALFFEKTSIVVVGNRALVTFLFGQQASNVLKPLVNNLQNTLEKNNKVRYVLNLDFDESGNLRRLRKGSVTLNMDLPCIENKKEEVVE